MPEFKFDSKEHLYTLDGKPLMGCTTVLNVINKPALIQWAANETVRWIRENCEPLKSISIDEGVKYEVSDKALDKAKVAHRKKKEKAADWGSIVHAAVESWIKSRQIPAVVVVKEVSYEVLPEHRTAIDFFVKWAEDNKVQFFESEKQIYSKDWWVAGTVDFVCKIDGKLMVGDLKTSSDIYETMFFQTAAYAKMLIEMGEYPRFDGMVVVNCTKPKEVDGKVIPGTFKTETRKDVDANIACFEAALTLHKRLNF